MQPIERGRGLEVQLKLDLPRDLELERKLQLERELELKIVVFSGSTAEGAALWNPPTPRHEGGGVWGNKVPLVYN